MMQPLPFPITAIQPRETTGRYVRIAELGNGRSTRLLCGHNHPAIHKFKSSVLVVISTISQSSMLLLDARFLILSFL